MIKYQEPEMEIIELGFVSVITESGGDTIYRPGNGTGGGPGESAGWGDF